MREVMMIEIMVMALHNSENQFDKLSDFDQMKNYKVKIG